MGRGWHKYIGPYVTKFDNYLSLIIPGQVPSNKTLFETKKELIVWMHNTTTQFGEAESAVLKDKRFYNKVKYFIVPSEAHKKLTLLDIPVEPERIYVIPNAIKPLKYNPLKYKDVKQIKLINTSTASRGMDILYSSILELKEDFRLEIYNDYYPDTEPIEPEFDPRVRFYGKTPRVTVREAIEASHIHAYPSTYPETFCLSQAEAMSAGLLCVTSDLGALPEVSNGYTTIYPYTQDREEHVRVFTEKLKEAIETVKSGKWNPEAQIEYINNKFSWNAIRDKWLEFHELL
jgi:glycosyltransferase involved in cell wall biosynthesis